MSESFYKIETSAAWIYFEKNNQNRVWRQKESVVQAIINTVLGILASVRSLSVRTVLKFPERVTSSRLQIITKFDARRAQTEKMPH